MRRVLVAVALLAMVTIGRAAAPIALLVVVDGLGAAVATPDHLPRLAARAAAPHATWTTARGVLPARTNPNHASMLTGYWPDGHGIVGNRYWDSATRTRVPMDQPGQLEAETIFDVAADRPSIGSAAFLAKAKLRHLFAAASDDPGASKVVWDPGVEYASDGVILRAVTTAMRADPPPALVVVGIADVDRTSHQAGPGTAAAGAAVARVDVLLDRFFDALVDRGLWDRIVVIVTADHGFAPVGDGGGIELPAATRDGVTWVDEGRVALGHAAGAGTPAVPPSILALPGVAGARTDLAAIGLGHPRAGSLMIMAALGHAFTLDAAGYRMRGDHGGEEERAVPFVVVGGHPALRRLTADVHPELPDVAPTLAAVLGLRDPRTRRPDVRRHGRRLPLWAGASAAP